MRWEPPQGPIAHIDSPEQAAIAAVGLAVLTGTGLLIAGAPRRTIPFAPFMAFGAMLAILASPPPT
jgi:prepilin signal peptidase PulO-like enzyme (type II secretory pathway)